MAFPLLIAAALFAPPTPPEFVAVSAAGPDVRGRVKQFGPNWSLTLGDATVSGRDLVSLRRADTPLPRWPAAAGLILANGDRVPGIVLGGDDLALQFRPAATPAAAWRVPLPAVQVAWLAAPPADAPPFPARYPWLDPDRKTDVVRLRNGDVLRGVLERFTDGGGVRLRADDKPTPLDPATVAAVALNPSLVAARRPKGAYARLVAADGTRITLSAATADGTTLRGTTTFNAKLELPLADVIAIDVFGGKAVYLSDLKPKAAVEPFAGLTWPWAADRTVKERPLALLGPHGVGTFDKGLGTHPRTTLTYDLSGKYRRFEATVGLDAETGRRGTATVRVLVDDKEQDVPGLAGLTAEKLVPVRVDVTKAKRLTLVVDFGPGGDVQADVNWADARVIE